VPCDGFHAGPADIFLSRTADQVAVDRECDWLQVVVKNEVAYLIIRFFDKNIENVFIAAFYAAPPLAVKDRIERHFQAAMPPGHRMWPNKTIPSFCENEYRIVHRE
jgi:hypothetical protein